MSYLLDTNVVSELTKAQPDKNCLSWMKAKQGQCALSTITLAELRYGIERLPDGKRKSQLETKFSFFCEDYAEHCWDFDAASAIEWGRYATELEALYGADCWKTIDLRDTMIAAIAREYGLTVATRNVRNFPNCTVENPFVESTQ